MRKVGLSVLKFLGILLATFFILDTFIFLIEDIVDGQSILYPLVATWALLAYIILPRIHRVFTKIYLPDYYVGRTKTTDGFYGDPINIAFIGGEKSLHSAMKEAGWAKADDLTFKSSLKMIWASVRKKSYQKAPVSSLFLFARKQDFAYQQEINGNPRVRHHIRFWKVPSGWWLPGGHQVDWLAAATFDKSVGLSLYTGQITHKVSSDTDEERDYVVETISKTEHFKSVSKIKNFTTAFHSRNGGGDRIKTDGSMPFVQLKEIK
ncbi:LssY C-terminal domain-containing protein [Candidatus Saccharibacteria bacterium]|nr:LssY C-terminal domain-containing protein [Candidatus Saccharibacteria bacterium]